MAQRTRNTEEDLPILLTEPRPWKKVLRSNNVRTPLSPHVDDQRPLTRIAFERSEWDELNWYVQFSNKDLGQLSPGEFISLEEELRAIERTIFRRMTGKDTLPGPVDEDVRRYHHFFRNKLMALAEGALIAFSTFELDVTINYRGWLENLVGQRWLEYHFAELLKTFHFAVVLCPYEKCEKLFLRPRANATYCSRQCQNRAAMHAIRKRGKQPARPSAKRKQR